MSKKIKIQKPKTLVICSGGLDSTTLAYQTAKEANLLALLSFDYGQRHKIELQYAQKTAEKLGVLHHVVSIASIGALLQSSLTQQTLAVPQGRYTQQNMANTVVPNRNAIMLTIAFALADTLNAEAVALAVHGGDHFIYPDCRPEFIAAFAKMQALSLGKTPAIALLAPYVNLDKADIARLMPKYQVPVEETWSCYNAGPVQCGRCATCIERIMALKSAQVADSTVYQDPDFWKSQSALSS